MRKEIFFSIKYTRRYIVTQSSGRFCAQPSKLIWQWLASSHIKFCCDSRDASHSYRVCVCANKQLGYRTTLVDIGLHTTDKVDDTNSLFLCSVCEKKLRRIFYDGNSSLWTCSRSQVSDLSLLHCVPHEFLFCIHSLVCLYSLFHNTMFGCFSRYSATRQELTSTSISTAYTDCMNGLSADNNSVYA